MLTKAEMHQKVEEIIGDTRWSDRLVHIEIDPNDDPEHNFVRIYLWLTGVSTMPTDDLIALQVAIEDGLAPVDERVASVRFAGNALGKANAA